MLSYRLPVTIDTSRWWCLVLRSIYEKKSFKCCCWSVEFILNLKIFHTIDGGGWVVCHGEEAKSSTTTKLPRPPARDENFKIFGFDFYCCMKNSQPFHGFCFLINILRWMMNPTTEYSHSLAARTWRIYTHVVLIIIWHHDTIHAYIACVSTKTAGCCCEAFAFCRKIRNPGVVKCNKVGVE